MADQTIYKRNPAKKAEHSDSGDSSDDSGSEMTSPVEKHWPGQGERAKGLVDHTYLMTHCVEDAENMPGVRGILMREYLNETDFILKFQARIACDACGWPRDAQHD